MFEEQAKHELFKTVKAFHAYKQEDGQSVSSYLLKMKSYLDILERLGYHMPNELDLTEKGLPKKAKNPIVLASRGGKIQKDKKKPQGAKGKDKGKTKLAYAPKLKIPPPPKRDNPTKDSICHHCKEGLRKRRKLKHGTLNLYVGNGMRATVEAIRSVDLILPNGLVIVLDNFHHAPSITRGVVSLFWLVDNGYKHTFMNYGIFAIKDVVCYFNAIPYDDIYEIGMHNLYPNVSSI
ncbi:hypothetical protein Tco_0070672 [Tanacetum coccineum]